MTDFYSKLIKPFFKKKKKYFSEPGEETCIPFIPVWILLSLKLWFIMHFQICTHTAPDKREYLMIIRDNFC